MTDFKAKMHQIRLRLGLRPRPRWGNFSAHPDHPLAGFWGRFAAEGETAAMGWRRGGKRGGEGEGGEVEGREREGPKLLLNQGPSETCYATAPTVRELSVVRLRPTVVVHSRVVNSGIGIDGRGGRGRMTADGRQQHCWP